jgi:hypothetical protein
VNFKILLGYPLLDTGIALYLGKIPVHRESHHLSHSQSNSFSVLITMVESLGHQPAVRRKPIAVIVGRAVVSSISTLQTINFSHLPTFP